MEKKSWIIEEQFVGWGHATVWAETEEEARELANADINSFDVEDEHVSEWTIESVEEL